MAIMACGADMLLAQDTIRYGDSSSIYLCAPPIVQNSPNDAFDYRYYKPRGNLCDAFISCRADNYDTAHAKLIHRSDYQGYVVNQPTIIYGIAATSTADITTQQTSGTNDTSQFEYEAYAMLVIKEGGNYYHADSARMHNYPPSRHFVYPQSVSDRPDIGDTVVGAYEFYFPEPIVVADTFFVGTRFTDIDCPTEGKRYVHSQAGGLSGNINHQFQLNESMGEYNMTENGFLGCYYPIIVPPNTDSFDCPRVEYFRRTGYVDGRPLFDWSASSGQRPFQVAYGPADQDPDSFIMANASTHPYLLPASDFDTGVLYAARCRGRCHHMCPVHDTMVWGEWSDTVQFYYRPENSVGIALPKGERIAFTLSPNPARDEVTVAVTAGENAVPPCEVVLRDEQGRELLRRRMVVDPGSSSPPTKEGTRLTLSTRGLAAGLYLVTIESPQGSSTQKLLVERN